jgi:nitrite reductase/ring-hydroxylating ferredoxin subunit
VNAHTPPAARDETHAVDAHAGPQHGAAPDTAEAVSPAELLAEVDVVIRRLEHHPDPAVRDDVATLLAGIDAVHRTGLTRMMEGIRAMGGDAFLNRLAGDTVVRLLLMSYDLLAVDRRVQTEDALDLVRPHLHSHGIGVELVDVIGSVVRVQLHGMDATDVDPLAVRADIEAALREGLIGFMELEVGGPRAPEKPVPLVSLGPRRALHRPVHRAAAEAASVEAGSILAVDLDGEPVLLINVAGDFHAVSNRCGTSPLPLQFSVLDGDVLCCSWHGCRYDVRTGRRTDGGEERLRIYPVRVADGMVEVAIAVEPAVDGRGG